MKKWLLIVIVAIGGWLFWHRENVPVDAPVASTQTEETVFKEVPKVVIDGASSADVAIIQKHLENAHFEGTTSGVPYPELNNVHFRYNFGEVKSVTKIEPGSYWVDVIFKRESKFDRRPEEIQTRWKVLINQGAIQLSRENTEGPWSVVTFGNQDAMTTRWSSGASNKPNLQLGLNRVQ